MPGRDPLRDFRSRESDFTITGNVGLFSQYVFLNDHWFTSLKHARQMIAAWRDEYNTERTHSSLGDITPAEFVAAYRQRV